MKENGTGRLVAGVTYNQMRNVNRIPTTKFQTEPKPQKTFTLALNGLRATVPEVLGSFLFRK